MSRQAVNSTWFKFQGYIPVFKMCIKHKSLKTEVHLLKRTWDTFPALLKKAKNLSLVLHPVVAKKKPNKKNKNKINK